MFAFVNWFTKITGWPVQKLLFNTKIKYEDKAKQGRRIKGPAIIVSNHTSVFDYAVILFVFFSRTLRYQMAELLFEKKFLGPFLKALGGIKVDRNANNFAFVSESEKILKKGGIVGIFPESRIPRKDEVPPLEFKPSAVYLALLSGVDIVPLYTNGSYFHVFKKEQRAVVVIGSKINVAEMYDDNESEKENLSRISNLVREKIIKLGELA